MQNLSSILAGLTGDPKSIDSSLHYDAEGSRLFDEILAQPEYYVARTENELLRRCAAEVISAIPAADPIALLELGASDESKASHLLSAGAGRIGGYLPVNLEPNVLHAMKARLASSHPALAVEPIWADFLDPLSPPSLEAGGTLLAYFPGATLSQLNDDAVVKLMTNVLQAGGRWRSCAFLIAADVCTDPDRVFAAYNDAAGRNAAFNLNLLRHLNRLGDGDFDPSRFRHVASWNPALSRIEFYLRSDTSQACRFAGRTLHLEAAELIDVGVSYKRSHEQIEALSARAGWTLRRCWTSADRSVALHLLSPTASPAGASA